MSQTSKTATEFGAYHSILAEINELIARKKELLRMPCESAEERRERDIAFKELDAAIERGWGAATNEIDAISLKLENRVRSTGKATCKSPAQDRIRTRQQWVAVEQIVAQIDEELSEDQFRSLCAALQVKDPEAVEWGLDTLSLYGTLQ